MIFFGRKTLLFTRVYLCGLLLYYYAYLILNRTEYFHFQSLWGSVIDLGYNDRGNLLAGLLFSEYTVIPFFLFLMALTAKYLFFGLRNFEKFVFIVCNISIIGFLANLGIRSASDAYLFVFASWFLCLDSESLQPATQRALNIGIRFQMSCVYFFTAMLKTGDAWRKDFSAIEFVLKSSYAPEWMVRGVDALPPWFFKATTVGTLAFEIGVAFLILWGRSPKLDGWLAIGVLIFHGLLGLLPPLGLFAFVFALNGVLLGGHGLSDRLANKLQATLDRVRSGIVFLLRGFKPHFAVYAVIAFLCVSNFSEWLHFQNPFREAAKHYELHQTWQMFAPDPPTTNQWVEVVALDASGTLISVLDPRKKIGERPTNLTAYYGNRLGFSFFGYNFHSDDDPQKHKKRLQLAANVATFFCLRNPEYTDIEVAYFITPISIREHPHPLDGTIQKESIVHLHCKTLESDEQSLLK